MDEANWKNLKAGYGIPYDPRPALNRLKDGDTSAWNELWTELHHQGDVGVASYAAVPLLIEVHQHRDIPDWQTYGLIGTIEICRDRSPRIPDWLEPDYKAAWDAIVPLACIDLLRTTDELTVRSILAAIAISKGVRPLGDLILQYSGDELSELIES